jgi:hypothetical protein
MQCYIYIHIYILWRIDPLLGNGSVTTFPWEPRWATIGCLLLGNGSVKTPKTIRDNKRQRFPWGPLWGYIMRSSTRADSCQKLREFNWRRVCLSDLLSRYGSSSRDGSLNDCKEMTTKKLGCEKKTSCMLQLQWDWYNYCVEVRSCWLVTTENPSACVTVNCKVWK